MPEVILPKPPPDRSPLATWMLQVFQRIGMFIEQPRLQITYIEPANPQDGYLYFADGTQWNPGSGRGVYIADSSEVSGYRFLG